MERGLRRREQDTMALRRVAETDWSDDMGRRIKRGALRVQEERARLDTQAYSWTAPLSRTKKAVA